MTYEIAFVFGLLALTILLFIIDRIRMDVVALMVVVALAVSGVIAPEQTVSGFGQSIVVMIAGLFVVGEGLFRTGIAASAGHLLLRVGGSNEVRLLLLMIPMVALLSAFMSSTGAVALFIPVVLSMCRKARLSPSRMLMPLAFASLIGGMLTLIGTPPNVVVSGQMEGAGLAPFGFFDFTPIGLVVLLVGTLYLVFVARHLLPEGELLESEHPHLREFAERYGVTDHLHRIKVPVGSDLVGKTVAEAGVRTVYETTLFAIRRNGRLVSSLFPVLAQTRIAAGDTLMAYARPADVERLCENKNLTLQGFPEGEARRLYREFGVAEVLLRARSQLIGSTLKEGRFRERFNLSVIGVRRNNEPLYADFDGTPLEPGDSLLLAGGWRFIEQLKDKRDFVILETPAEMSEAPTRSERAPVALLIMLVMMVLMVSGALSSLSAILLACFAMIALGCVTMQEAYKSLNSTSLVLIAGMLPLALAMKQTGGLDLIVDRFIGIAGNNSPLMLCAGLFIFTSLFSQFISNTATTVLVAPIALAAALGVGVNPEPLMMTVAIAASTAFATPIASPVNTLVLAPGNYRFIDFVRVGLPLQLLVMGVSLLIIPMLFPF